MKCKNCQTEVSNFNYCPSCGNPITEKAIELEKANLVDIEKDGKTFGIGKKVGAASFLQILAPEINDRMLADFLDMESNVVVSMHVQSVDQVNAIKTVKRKITDLQKMKIEEQKKAVRAGYDMDIIPSDLATYNNEATKLLQDLQSRNERMFLLTFIVLNVADTKQKLDNNVFQASSIAQKYNCQLVRLDFRQEQGLMSSLPLAYNQIEIQRGLTTSSVAIFVPFTTQELFQTGDEALYCGINALSNNLIMVDRKKLKNPNGLILGTPGSGKSFSAKREIANVFLVTDDDIIICDPEAEYAALVHKFDGQVIKKGKKFVTQKTDSDNHGLGTQIVTETVTRLGGKCDFSFDEKTFSATVYIPITNN